ncbi:MAG: hypothetical protein JEZ07_07250 [Phycisphaerae bacterium]|nr:hypothetical protein [Phycisphaerae bacterium]
MADRLFICCVVLYFINRLVLKPITVGKIDFFHSYFNDLICIPFLLPVVLYLAKILKLRTHDEPPDIYELVFHVLLWSVVFEFYGPVFGQRHNYPIIGDPWDVVCYASGALLAGIYWNLDIKKIFRSFKLCKSTDKKIGIKND